MDERLPVRHLRLPVDLWRESVAHGVELTHEMQVLAAGYTGSEPQHHVPTRLTEFVAQLRARFVEAPDQDREIDEAADAGLTEIDVIRYLPREAAAATKELAAILDEVDELCRSGEMLTLATPPQVKAYRDWYLGEITSQLGGSNPVPWPDWLRTHHS